MKDCIGTGMHAKGIQKRRPCQVALPCLILQGGYDEDGVFVPGSEPMLPYFDSMARRVSGCEGGGEGEKLIMGPTWDNVSGLGYGW
jgi:hypothetical protein